MFPVTLKLVPVAAPMFGVVRTGLVLRTTAPEPVIAENSLYSGSQSAAVVNAVPIHLH